MVPSNGYAYFDERQPRPCKNFSSKSYMGPTRKFYLIFLMLPSIIAFWYAIAIFFPPSWRENVPFFIWTNSGLLYDTNGEVFVCPKEFICAKGILQVLLLVLARITAYTSFVVQGLVFISKMHSLIYHLSSTYAALFLPFESLHNMHAFVGSAYFVMIMIHSFSHLVRWSLRQELDSCTSRVGVSGIIGMIAMIVSVTVMSSLAKSESACLFTIPYGIRRTFHRLGSLPMALALLAHTKRTMAISLIFTLAWAIDYLYDILRRTHRLDIVEFSTLPDGTGTQMLWRNQNGFRPKSGEYVQVMVPWLPHGGKEWHPFSTYLHEATKEGMNEINRNDVGEEIVLDKKIDGVQEIDARKTALILIGFQNEFIDPKGLLYDDVKAVIQSTQCVPKIENLLQVARTAGFHIIHAPVSYTPDTPDRPNKCARVPNKLSSGKYFSEGSWNAEIITQLQPEPSETVLDIKCALDCFEDNILEKILVEKGISTLVFGGLLTNGCVESTMRTAYTKNFNNVALVDGTACNSNTEQLAAVNFNFKMFATCMTCSEIRDILENKIAIINNAMRRSSSCNSFAKISDKNEMSMHSLHGLDLEGAEFINVVLESEKSLENFCVDSLSRPYSDIVDTAIVARKGLEQHETTQVFIFSCGDWTQRLVNELGEREKMSPCWVVRFHMKVNVRLFDTDCETKKYFLFIFCISYVELS